MRRIIGIAALIFLLPCAGHAHAERMNDIDHLIFIRIAPGHVNLEAALHFHENPSRQSRSGRMDANRDGRISTLEIDQYCASVDEKVLKRFSLQVGTKTIPFAPLYRPEVDLLGDSSTGSAPHFLKLFLTATLPGDARAGEALRIIDRNFSAIPGQSRMEVRGPEGELLRSSFSRDIFFKMPAFKETLRKQNNIDLQDADQTKQITR